jgi:hypothetical protein
MNNYRGDINDKQKLSESIISGKILNAVQQNEFVCKLMTLYKNEHGKYKTDRQRRSGQNSQ